MEAQKKEKKTSLSGKPKLSDFEKFRSNPFLDKMKWHTFMYDKKEMHSKKVENIEIFNSETAELSNVYMKERHQVTRDRRAFTMVYDQANIRLKDLSTPELRVLIYVFNNLAINQDVVYINFPDCMDFCGYDTLVPVYNALAGMVQKGVLARHDGSSIMFYINPFIFFKGDSVHLYLKYQFDKKNTPKEEKENKKEETIS